jgi:hypothetical protein
MDGNLYNFSRSDGRCGRDRDGRYRMSYLSINRRCRDGKGRNFNRLLNVGFMQSLVKV